MASVDELMNLARPKSETLIIDVAGFLDEYRRFSGYNIHKLAYTEYSTLISLWIIL